METKVTFTRLGGVGGGLQFIHLLIHLPFLLLFIPLTLKMWLTKRKKGIGKEKSRQQSTSMAINQIKTLTTSCKNCESLKQWSSNTLTKEMVKDKFNYVSLWKRFQKASTRDERRETFVLMAWVGVNCDVTVKHMKRATSFIITEILLSSTFFLLFSRAFREKSFTCFTIIVERKRV